MQLQQNRNKTSLKKCGQGSIAPLGGHQTEVVLGRVRGVRGHLNMLLWYNVSVDGCIFGWGAVVFCVNENKWVCVCLWLYRRNRMLSLTLSCLSCCCRLGPRAVSIWVCCWCVPGVLEESMMFMGLVEMKMVGLQDESWAVDGSGDGGCHWLTFFHLRLLLVCLEVKGHKPQSYIISGTKPNF